MTTNSVPDKTESFDAREKREAIAEGIEQSPEKDLDLDRDYAAAQKMSEGTLSAKEVEKLVAPEHEVSQPEEVDIAGDGDRLPEASGNPEDYRELAKEVQPPA